MTRCPVYLKVCTHSHYVVWEAVLIGLVVYISFFMYFTLFIITSHNYMIV